MERRETLSLNEWAVLACLVERPRHGYDIAAELAPEAELGTVWRVSRQLVYRALDRLVALRLAEPHGAEPGAVARPAGSMPPPRQAESVSSPGSGRRCPTSATSAAPCCSSSWWPAGCASTARRSCGPSRPPFAEPLAALAAAPPPDDPVALWRHHSAAAVRALLEDLEG